MKKARVKCEFLGIDPNPYTKGIQLKLDAQLALIVANKKEK